MTNNWFKQRDKDIQQICILNDNEKTTTMTNKQRYDCIIWS